jgi:hypothetical protein
MYGAPIIDIKFHTTGAEAVGGLARRHVISSDKHIVKVRGHVITAASIACCTTAGFQKVEACLCRLGVGVECQCLQLFTMSFFRTVAMACMM